MTDWNALKWYQVEFYRGRAITKEDLKDDKDLLKFWFKTYGYKGKIPSDFVGFESFSGGSDIIELDKNELINFD